MGPLSDINMNIYIQCERTDPYNLSANVFGYNRKEIIKLDLVDFRLHSDYAQKLRPDAPTFKINGHEASA